ncbi:fungal-specific transcription factor domain-containing protein [Podospora didyma]|uniref:Fungal-specific transcription factor domain-containing protein n=1 Tax=Podospora didyma TaxID=330526 RepID=A0AAE0NS12_9PEZI|nr:fungal-specific transcription factor domain-containing protein [Podospora didyma]
MKSFNGCWTCRVRRKKCDETHPVCSTCVGLGIICHYGQEKPEWMDGGIKQQGMVKQLKRDIRENALHRLPLGERAFYASASASADALPGPEPFSDPQLIFLAAENSVVSSLHESGSSSVDRREDDGGGGGGESSGWPDACLLMFYMENLLPFLFPFYRPSPLQGGRSWILDMLMSSPVVRQTALCQSAHFFSLALGTTTCDGAWAKVLAQTRAAFDTLRRSLQDINGRGGIAGHEREAVRILASIMQLQRFDIAMSSFENCHAHLTAACALLKLILESALPDDAAHHVEPNLANIMSRLGPPSWVLPSQCPVQVPSAEETALRFSSALVIFDDIIASTALQRRPTLHEYHHGLLTTSTPSVPAPVDMEAVVGCKNWVLLQIGEIAALDAWKQQCKMVGNLDVMELVRRATAIKDTLTARLAHLQSESPVSKPSGVLDLLAPHGQPSPDRADQHCLVTQVWACAALIYLSVVVSGWQPASPDVRHHVGQVISLLTHQLSPPSLLRTMAWPFCVAGCLAEPAHQGYLREMVETLRPANLFGTLRKALEIMQDVWRDGRGGGDSSMRDLASCLRNQGDLLVLLV